MRSTSPRDGSPWPGSDDDQLAEDEHQSTVAVSGEMRHQHGDSGQEEPGSHDTVGFGGEACDSGDSDDDDDSGGVDDSAPSSSEDDERFQRKETSSDDDKLYKAGATSDSTDCVGMTPQQREAMHHAVKNGDIDLLDDLLDLPCANIRMEWFGENLLMAAIRANQQEMAEFLLDNGVDPNFEATLVDMRNARKGNVDCYTIDCRQMAYDHSNFDLVNLIDEINGRLWPFVNKRKRVIRMKKPLAEKLREKLEAENKTNEANSEREVHSGASRRQHSESKQKKKVRIQTEATHLPDTSFTEDKRKREPDQTRPRLLTTQTSNTSLEDQYTNSTLPELSEVNQSSRRTYMYKYTRDFLARQKAREREKKEQQADNTGRHSVRNKWYSSRHDINLPSAQQNTATQGLRFINGPDVSKAGVQSPTRLLSPWREDDEVLLRHLKSRSGQSSYRTQKPVLSRKQALLPLLPERTTPKTLNKVTYNSGRGSPQSPVVKSPLREFSPIGSDWARPVNSEATRTSPSPTVTTPLLPTRSRSGRGRSRTATVTAKSNEKCERAKTHRDSPAFRKTVKWDFDIDPLVPPTLVRFTAPPARSLQELEDTIEYSVPMAASLAYT